MGAAQGAVRNLSYYAAPDGSPQAENVEGTTRQAAGSARHPGSAPERVPDLPPAEATASRLPELPHVQGSRHRAADHSRSVRAQARVMARVAVDAMGGDCPPEVVVEG